MTEQQADRLTDRFLTSCLLLAVGGVSYLIMSAIIQWVEQL